MQTEAVFNNIAERIQSEIGKAEKSIFIAVAWFTNKNLFLELITKAKSGCTVFLIISNDSINQNSKINFDQLSINTSRVYKIGNGDSELMHNKFCIIDHSTAITGSYNWSYKAERNFENVIITYNDTVLAEQFISEFNFIRKQYYPDEPAVELIFPLNKIIKRLEILKNHILLEDIQEINKETIKISKYDFNEDILDIITDIKKEEFGSAINKIKSFITQNQQLSVWNDPEVLGLKFQIKNLENQLNAFDNEKIEIEKLLFNFKHRHTIELGNFILEILKLRKLKFKADKIKYQEAENDEKIYGEEIETEKKIIQFKLTEEEEIEIKKNFRKATFLCHPDKVKDGLKDAAQKIFIELKAAYETNDVKKVNEILNELEKEHYFESKSHTVSERDKLLAAIARLHKKIRSVESDIIIIKQSETFITINSIGNWDIYFNLTKERLKKQLKVLQKEIEDESTSPN